MAASYNNLPGVRRREVDLSDVLVPRTGSNVATVIRSTQGRVNRPYFVTSQKEYIFNFGKPYFGSGVKKPATGAETAYEPVMGYGAYAAYYALSETGSMYVVRDAGANDKYSDYLTSSISTPTTVYYVSSGDAYYESTTSGALSASIQGVTPVAATRVIPTSTPSSGVSVNPWEVGSSFDTDSYISSLEVSAAAAVRFAHVAPGAFGDNYAVTIEYINSASDWAYAYDAKPVSSTAEVFASTSSLAANLPKASEICKISVYEKGASDTWESYYSTSADRAMGKVRLTPVETFYASFSRILDDNNNSLYVKDVVNGNSKYVYITVGADGSAEYSISASANTLLPNGSDSAGYYVKKDYLLKLTSGAYETKTTTSESSWKIFTDRKQTVVDFVLSWDSSDDQKKWASNIVGQRLDCFAELQSNPVSATTPEAIINNEKYGFVAPSYVALNVGYAKVFDQFSGRDIYLPNSIFALMADLRTIRTGRVWDVPAGTTRGIVPCKNQHKIYTDGELDTLIGRNLNPVSFERGYGFAIISYRTAQLKKSALDRKNVRLNLLYIENNIEQFLKQFIFELNTDITRSRARVGGDSFLGFIKAAGGLYDYTVICDESNNSADVIDTNTMNYAIGLQPVKGIDWINFTTVVTRTGADFNSLRIQYV